MIFSFQVYTGLYYKDLFNLKKEHLTKDHECGLFILGERYKNGENNIIPLFKFPDAEKIIERYANQNASNPFVFDNNTFLAEQVYNQRLKQIAHKAGIDKNISNKIARHTNAQLWIRLGVRKPIVSKILGHAKEQSTDAYFSVNIIDVIEGIKHIDAKSLGI